MWRLSSPLALRERSAASAASGRVRARGAGDSANPHPPRFARRPLPWRERGLVRPDGVARSLAGVILDRRTLPRDPTPRSLRRIGSRKQFGALAVRQWRRVAVGG